MKIYELEIELEKRKRAYYRGAEYSLIAILEDGVNNIHYYKDSLDYINRNHCLEIYDGSYDNEQVDLNTIVTVIDNYEDEDGYFVINVIKKENFEEEE